MQSVSLNRAPTPGLGPGAGMRSDWNHRNCTLHKSQMFPLNPISLMQQVPERRLSSGHAAPGDQDNFYSVAKYIYIYLKTSVWSAGAWNALSHSTISLHPLVVPWVCGVYRCLRLTAVAYLCHITHSLLVVEHSHSLLRGRSLCQAALLGEQELTVGQGR